MAHNHKRLVFLVRLLLILCSLSASAMAEIKPHGVFGDQMVLQRSKAIVVLGTADAGEAVTVSLASQTVQTKADAAGDWRVELPAMDAGGPYTLQIGTHQFSDVMVGEVWVASGQSNMQWTLDRIDRGDIPVNDQIRSFRQETLAAMTPSKQAHGRWLTARPENADDLSAVAYFFAAQLQKELGVTIGILHVSQGSTSIQQWIPLETWAQFTTPEWLERFRSKQAEFDAAYARTVEELAKLDPATLGREYQKAHREVRSKYGPDLKAAKLDVNGGLPSIMWNAYIAPFTQFPVRGWIWYQGEFATGLFGSAKPGGYADRQRALIAAVRQHWRDDALPFYYVQLPNYGDDAERSGDSGPNNWALVRNEQRLALDVPHTAMVTTLDVGGALHPSNKQPVGERLAAAALTHTYAKPRPWSGPLPQSAKVEGSHIRIQFSHAQGLTDPNGGEVEGFAVTQIIQTGKKPSVSFAPAKAKIDKQDVLVAIPDGVTPAQVYFACNQNPTVELVNEDGFPASPFILTVEK